MAGQGAHAAYAEALADWAAAVRFGRVLVLGSAAAHARRDAQLLRYDLRIDT
eukprot:SAG11_NODE_1247_length_5401_cov_2.372878_9_plen_52_part_00